ncbi:MAG: hypothetical protein NUW21_02780 [Elusimicrobia bacterium]|nr:hypothetical protein [Elusimicrobiota bacterium]
MKKTLLVIIVVSAFAAACKERKAPRPNYEGSHSASEKAHESLDKEAGGY